METITTILGIILAIYLIFKLNRVATVAIEAVNTTVELADESIGVYATDVKINLAQKRIDQLDELDDMDYIPHANEITTILEGKIPTKTKARKKRDENGKIIPDEETN